VQTLPGGALGWLFDDPGYGFVAGIFLFLVGLLMLGVATLRAGAPLVRARAWGRDGRLDLWCVSAGGAFVVIGLI
jgi:hypothetical protein